MSRPDESLVAQLAGVIAAHRRGRGQALIVGLCGPQGSGKSTLAAALAAQLRADAGLGVAVLSLDDLYLSRAERARLAHEVHPLFVTRGVPGTHDVDLGIRVLQALGSAGPDAETAVPAFDKATDEPLEPAKWPRHRGRVDVVLFEGWCVGARAQEDQALGAPVNALEAHDDSEGRWRRFANAQLAGCYVGLFSLLDLLVLLRPDGFERVAAWRSEQEHGLARTRPDAGHRSAGSRVMSDAEVLRFVQHFERLTRHVLAEMPGRADVVVDLGPQREVLGIHRGRDTVASRDHRLNR